MNLCVAPVTALGLLVWSLPVSACAVDGPCPAGAIDDFFLPLISSSLADPNRVAALPPQAVADPNPSPLPPSGGAIIIKPPPAPDTIPPTTPSSEAPPPHTVVPVQRLLVGQSLFSGLVQDGGEVDMFIKTLPQGQSRQDRLPDQATIMALSLAPDKENQGMLAMEQLVSLPVADIWPLTSFSQDVAMRIACGACGPDGGVAQFDGAGRLEIGMRAMGPGKITGINLRNAAGATAQGEMHFSLQTAHDNVFTDDTARMRLVVDRRATHLSTRLFAWRGPQQQLSGIFIGTPDGDTEDLGGFAGQFSGAGCVPDCGVEN